MSRNGTSPKTFNILMLKKNPSKNDQDEKNYAFSVKKETKIIMIFINNNN